MLLSVGFFRSESSSQSWIEYVFNKNSVTKTFTETLYKGVFAVCLNAFKIILSIKKNVNTFKLFKKNVYIYIRRIIYDYNINKVISVLQFFCPEY